MGLLFCLTFSITAIGQREAENQQPTPVPPATQWEGSVLPVSIAAVPPLHALWSVELKKIVRTPDVIGYVAGVAVTDNIAVVSFTTFCANPPRTADCITMHLASFDRDTGRFRKSVDMKAKELYSFAPQIAGATSKTFLTLQDEQLTEYDEDLKPTNLIRFPRGMALSMKPGYEAEIWAEVTKRKCLFQGLQVYRLNEKRSLILGCGHDVGLVDERQQPLFAETYYRNLEAIGNPDCSQDGNRFVLTYSRNATEPPLHGTLSYVLYDLHQGKLRKVAFNLGEGVAKSVAETTLSADGSMFAAAGKDSSAPSAPKLWMYRLPE